MIDTLFGLSVVVVMGAMAISLIFIPFIIWNQTKKQDKKRIAEKQISFLDIFRFILALVVTTFVYIAVEEWGHSLQKESYDQIVNIFIIMFFGVCLPAFLSILAGGLVVSWRYKLVTVVLFIYPIAVLFVPALFAQYDDYVIHLLHVVNFTFAFLGAIAAVFIWKTLEDYVNNKYFKHKRKQTTQIKPKISLLLILLSIFSIPLTFIAILMSAIAILGLSALLAYILMYFPMVPYVLIIAVVVAPLLGLFSVFKSLWAILSPRPYFQSAIRLEMKRHPELKEIIEEVCSRVKTKKPNNVILHAEPTFFVTQGKMNILNGQVKGRTLTIGMPLLKQISTTELKSILTHEFAHFSGNDTLYSTIVSPVYRGIASSFESLSDSPSSMGSTLGAAVGILSLPSIFFLGLFLTYFATIDNMLSRSRELRADLIASSLYGKDVFSKALIKVTEIGHHFNDKSYDLAQKCKDDFFSSYNNYLINDKASLETYRERALNEVEDSLDSHPTLQTRLFNLPNTQPRVDIKYDALKGFDQEEKELSSSYTEYIKKLKELHEYFLEVQTAQKALEDGFLVVCSVVDNSKAAIAGIKINDVLLTLCDEKVTTANDIMRILKGRDSTRQIKIQVLRKKEEITKTIELEAGKALGLDFYKKEND